MEKIIKKDGYVYLQKSLDVNDIHVSLTNLGKDPDDERWNPKKKKDEKKEVDE